jgi:6-pyruvoyltetrahydropterin/6-carboxytetrahydropterin synthase
MHKFRNTKRIDGFSTCFRQFSAEDTHCKFLHGYGVYFDITFEGDLDHRNWVADFGIFKRAKSKIDELDPSEWFKWLLDHTTLVSDKDPYLDQFKQMDKDGIIQLRILPDVGAERLAQYLFNKISSFCFEEFGSRIYVVGVTVYEHEKNSAYYGL